MSSASIDQFVYDFQDDCACADKQTRRPSRYIWSKKFNYNPRRGQENGDANHEKPGKASLAVWAQRAGKALPGDEAEVGDRGPEQECDPSPKSTHGNGHDGS